MYMRNTYISPTQIFFFKFLSNLSTFPSNFKAPQRHGSRRQHKIGSNKYPASYQRVLHFKNLHLAFGHHIIFHPMMFNMVIIKLIQKNPNSEI